jgi:hypothetical protein
MMMFRAWAAPVVMANHTTMKQDGGPVLVVDEWNEDTIYNMAMDMYNEDRVQANAI